MAANNEGEKPFMGKIELDPDDPETQQRILDLQARASKVGSEVVVLTHDRQRTLVIYGMNHPYQVQDPR